MARLSTRERPSSEASLSDYGSEGLKFESSRVRHILSTLVALMSRLPRIAAGRIQPVVSVSADASGVRCSARSPETIVEISASRSVVVEARLVLITFWGTPNGADGCPQCEHGDQNEVEAKHWSFYRDSCRTKDPAVPSPRFWAPQSSNQFLKRDSNRLRRIRPVARNLAPDNSTRGSLSKHDRRL
jgi:hypothetical protein